MLGGLRHRSKAAKTGWRRALPSYLAMTGELLGCFRTVPLWTYGAYLRNLRILPPCYPSPDQTSSAPLGASYKEI